MFSNISTQNHASEWAILARSRSQQQWQATALLSRRARPLERPQGDWRQAERPRMVLHNVLDSWQPQHPTEPGRMFVVQKRMDRTSVLLQPVFNHTVLLLGYPGRWNPQHSAAGQAFEPERKLTVVDKSVAVLRYGRYISMLGCVLELPFPVCSEVALRIGILEHWYKTEDEAWAVAQAHKELDTQRLLRNNFWCRQSTRVVHVVLHGWLFASMLNVPIRGTYCMHCVL